MAYSIDTRRFAESYLSHSLELARQGLELKEFDASVFSAVARDTGLREEDVCALHHPFHWYCFNQNGSSAFQVEQPKKQGEIAIVRLITPEVGLISLVEGFLFTYQGLLDAKIARLSGQS